LKGFKDLGFILLAISSGDNPVNSWDPSGMCNSNPVSVSFWIQGNCLAGAVNGPNGGGSKSTMGVIRSIAELTVLDGVIVIGISTLGTGDAVVGSTAEVTDTSVAKGTTVIGNYNAVPSHIEYAQSLGANYFSIAPEQWATMSEEEQWAANKDFLDQAIARGDTFEMSSSPEDPNAGKSFIKEVEYIQSKGYVLNGNTMVPSTSGFENLYPILLPLPPPVYNGQSKEVCHG
jgi:hypothetical protein